MHVEGLFLVGWISTSNYKLVDYGEFDDVSRMKVSSCRTLSCLWLCIKLETRGVPSDYVKNTNNLVVGAIGSKSKSWVSSWTVFTP
jgi:hypothetical protein